MATVTFKLDRNAKPTPEQIEMIRKARSVGYDPDCPPITPERLKNMKLVRNHGRKVLEARVKEQ